MPNPPRASTTPKHIALNELPATLQNRAGLVVGPAVTLPATAFGELSAHLADRYQVPRGDSFLETADHVLDSTDPDPPLPEAISEFFASSQHPSVTIRGAIPRWAAVLSLTLDSAFENALRAAEARRPVSRNVTVATDFGQTLPPRTLPVLKLLGSLESGDFVHSSASYRRRRTQWPTAARIFSDRLKGGPVLIIGFEAARAFLYDLLATPAEPPITPATILVPENEEYANDPQIPRLLDGRSAIFFVDATPEDLLSQTADMQRSGQQRTLPYPTTHLGRQADFSEFSGLATVVNDHLTSSIEASERNRLHELLFAPTQPNWDPYVHALDFRRTVTSDIMDDTLLLASTRTPGSSACAVIGGSASGKTVLLKRLAFDLASREALVVWLSPWFYQDTQNVLTKFFQQLLDAFPSRKFHRPIVVMDDPLAFGATTPADVLAAATSVELSIVLLIGVRSVDWGIRDDVELIGSAPLMGRFDLPDRLDEAEEAALGAYLVTLGIYANASAASRAVKESLSRYTRDILSVLYWLIPATRHAITQSVRDEYFRLGDSAAIAQIVVGRYRESGHLLKRAYEFAATAARYRTPLPIEVLVSALDVPYGDWLEAASPDAPAWGLLYPDSPECADTLYYRPRNAVVTEVVLEALNGGKLARGGELAALEALLSACTGSHPEYREFCTRALVPNSKLDGLTYGEGLRLYDMAVNALPLEDRTLLHHKGLWIKNRGKQPALAKVVLTEALHAKSYPYSTKVEPDQHIFTSLAANELDAIDAGIVSVDDGQASVRKYLHKARSSSFFNARAVHVGARLITQLLQRTAKKLSVGDRYRVANEALKDVDQTLWSLDSSNQGAVGVATADDVMMLESQRGELFATVGGEDDVSDVARGLWESHRNQEGFVLAARVLYGRAVQSDKGTLFKGAHSYCQERIRAVKECGVEPAPGLYEVALLNYYHWQVGRQTPGRTIERDIDWELVVEYSEAVLGAPGFEPLPHLYRYLRAVAAVHLGDWTAASAIWAGLRRSGMPRHLLMEHRDYLLDDRGVARVVQGTVTEAGQRRFLMVTEFGQDFHLDRGRRWPRSGMIAHAHIVFSFAGPTAVLAS